MRAVIFDLDGTLVDSQYLQFLAYRNAFEEINLPLNWEEWKSYWVKLSIDAYDWARIKKYKFDINFVRKRKKELYEKMIKEELKLKPGAFDLVNDLRKSGFKLAIASSSRIDSIQLIVDKFFSGIFDVLQSDTELSKRKPHPEIFKITMNKLGVLPSMTLIIEDSLNGYNAAIRSGAICVICPDNTLNDKNGVFPKAKMVINSLEQLNYQSIIKLFNK